MYNLETKRLKLRAWHESDAEALFKYASDPELGPRAGWPPHKSVEESRTIIKTVFNMESMWAVVLKETSEVIGCVGYLPALCSNLQIGKGECEVGYWIARPYWGKGICTEALRAIVELCFGKKGFSVLWGDYFPDNPASGRVMEKCGFTSTGDEALCPNLGVGGDKPVKVMRLPRETWEKMKNMESKLIAPCGLDCAKCDARIATINNDDELRVKTAKLWNEMNHFDCIKKEDINCMGCRCNEGPKTVFCSSLCEIRKCAIAKGFETCGECREKETCPKLAMIISHNEAAKENIKNKVK